MLGKKQLETWFELQDFAANLEFELEESRRRAEEARRRRAIERAGQEEEAEFVIQMAQIRNTEFWNSLRSRIEAGQPLSRGQLEVVKREMAKPNALENRIGIFPD